MKILQLSQIFHEGSYDELNGIYLKAMKDLKLDDQIIEAQKDLTRELLNHFLRNYPESIWVSQVEDKIIGFVISLQRGKHWNIANLVIDPEFKGKGFGKALFREVLPTDQHLIKTCIIPGSSPIAQTLFLKNKFHVQFSVFWLAGALRKPSNEETAPEDEDLSDLIYQPDELSSKILETLKEIDKHALGFTRTRDHRFWFEQNRELHLFREAGQTTGYVYLSPSRLGPLVAVSDRIQTGLLKSTLAGIKEGRKIFTAIPGTNTLAIEELLKRGVVVTNHSLFVSNIKSRRFETVILDGPSLL